MKTHLISLDKPSVVISLHTVPPLNIICFTSMARHSSGSRGSHLEGASSGSALPAFASSERAGQRRFQEVSVLAAAVMNERETPECPSCCCRVSCGFINLHDTFLIFFS